MTGPRDAPRTAYSSPQPAAGHSDDPAANLRATVRVAWALSLLLAPTAVLRVVGGAGTGVASRWILRVLGVRQLVAAGVVWRWPGARRAAAVVDATHACTAVAFGVASQRWRRAALADAAIAGGFAVSGFGR